MTDDATGTLSRTVASVCTQLRPKLTGVTALEVDAVTRRLYGPLQLAVAGRIKSGKSTVVNALLGRRVAPTDVRECTRIVTRFQYGTVDRVELVRRNGNRVTLPYDGEGLVPVDLGVETSDIAYIDAFLTSAALREVTVIDTPGLGSLDTASSQRTRELLGAEGLDTDSQVAIEQADAVLFVLTQAARADDVDALAMFHTASTPRSSSPINAVAILNKADQIVGHGAGGTGPGGVGTGDMQAAQDLAKAQAHTLRHRVADVLPLIGLLAEATETGIFTEADADALRRISALDAASRTLLFYSADLFVRPEIPIPVSARARLLERLDLFGIGRAVELLDGHPTMSTGELRRQLVEGSGFPALRGVVESVFRKQADGIKANVAIAALESLAGRADPPDRMHVEDALEELLQRPEAHQLRVLEAASLVTSGTVEMPEELAREVAALVLGSTPAQRLGLAGGTPAQLAEVALEAAGRWRSFATFGSTPAQSRIAHVIHRAYFLLWQELKG
ncbi:MAG TPA: dynamin family protein [Mycobacteriales bacterium]|nr:dynamin family protein [Mycobacteriales bacterium]